MEEGDKKRKEGGRNGSKKYTKKNHSNILRKIIALVERGHFGHFFKKGRTQPKLGVPCWK